MSHSNRPDNPSKPAGSKLFSAFTMGRNGSMVVDREKLHESDGYKRQVAALVELKKLGARAK